MAVVGVAAARYVGASVKRVEDKRILAGRGRYIGDIDVTGMLHAAFLRSPHAHATIKSVDVSRARAIPGVIAVFVAQDFEQLTNPMRLGPMPGLKTAAFGPLASDRVRFMGDPVAMVVAQSRQLAEDACEMIEVDFEPLTPVTTADAGLQPDCPPIFVEMGDNIVYHDSTSFGDLDAGFREAEQVIRETFRQHRYAPVPMETRGGLAIFDRGTESLTYHASCQAPQALRMIVSGLINQPADRFRVLVGDVGGAFGQKAGVYREDVAICAAAKQLGRPVKWIEDRFENLSAAGQAREETLEVEAAVKKDGAITGLRVRMIMDHGAYPMLPFPAPLFGIIARTLLPSAYRIRNYSFELTVVATNKPGYVPYRGPWEIETWVRERLLDIIGHELGIDPIEVRRTNLYHTDELPTEMVTGPTLEGITVNQTMERALELAGKADFVEKQRKARLTGQFLGFGMANYIEPAPGPPNYTRSLGLGGERSIVRLELDGHLTVITAQAPHGQGHETTLAQVAADAMGVPIEHVTIVHGDTRITPFSLVGTGGSRAATMASGAVIASVTRLKEKVFDIASAILEASPADLEIRQGVVAVRGVQAREIPLAQVATTATLAAGSLPPGVDTYLEAAEIYEQERGGWSGGTHCCWVEVDTHTGQVKIDRYLVVEDCGTLINPAIVDGQIRGGVAQGIGAVLYESCIYSETGQCLTTTMSDYMVPTTTEIPKIEIDHFESPPTDTVNFRGVGEGGAIVAPAALTAAIEDALQPFGVRITEQYLPPQRILELAGLIER